MNYSERAIRTILKRVARGTLSSTKAYEQLRQLPYETIAAARLDHHRHMRTGLPEAVFAPGKTFEQLCAIITRIHHAHHAVLVTRLDEPIYRRLKEIFPFLLYSNEGRIAYTHSRAGKTSCTPAMKRKVVALISAGTGDIPVAEEAAVTLRVMGCAVKTFYDCGVAGLHRLVDIIPVVRRAHCVICVAGMEGALASVVAGLVDKPVIAVPTSVGYGAQFKGLAPLLTMMNSCAPGVAVVNIDNGFGAACVAALMCR